MSYSWLIRRYHGCEYGLQTCLLTLKRRQSTKSQSSGTKDDLIEGFILAAAAQAKHISVLHFSPLFSSPLPLIVCMLMLYLSAGGTTCLVGEWPTFWVPAGRGCSGSGHQNCYIGPGCHYSPEGHPDSPWSFRDSQWNQSQGSDRNLHPISSQLMAPAVLDWGGMPWLHYSIGWGVSSTIISLQPLLSPGRWDSGQPHWGPCCPDFTWWWLHCGSCCLLYQWQALDYTHFSQSLSQLLTTLHQDEAEHPLSCPTVNMHRLLCPFPPHYFNLGWLYNEELAIAHCLPGATVHNTLDTIQNMGCIEVFNLFWDDCSFYRSNGIHPNNVAVKCYLLICSMHQHGAHLLLKPHYTHKLS